MKTLGALSCEDEVAAPRPIRPSFGATVSDVQASVAMSDWFAKCYRMTMGAREEVAKFRERRATLAFLPDPTAQAAADLLSPGVAMRSDPIAALLALGRGQTLRAFAQDPSVTEEAVQARKFDVLILSLMCFAVVSKGRAALAAFPAESEDFVSAMNRLQEWDDIMDCLLYTSDAADE